MADDTEPEGTDEDTGAPAPKRSLLERVLSAQPAAPTKPSVDRNGNPTKWSIDRLDSRERLFCFAAAAMAVVFSVLIYVGESHAKHPVHGKQSLSPATGLLLGLASGVALAVTTRIGRRALVGFVALFAFLSFGTTSSIVGLPFLVLAVWLLFRSYKIQKEATAKLRTDRAAGKTPAPATTRTSRAEAVAARRAAGRPPGRSKKPAAPEGNKRYTPKRPTPPPPPTPKPSWRERRAAKASD